MILKLFLEHALTDSLNSVLGGYIFLTVETVQFSNKHFQTNCTLEKADGLFKCDSFFFFFPKILNQWNGLLHWGHKESF